MKGRKNKNSTCNGKRKRKLRHPINFNENSLSGQSTTDQLLKNIPPYHSHNCFNLRLNQGADTRKPHYSNYNPYYCQGVSSFPQNHCTNVFSNKEMNFESNRFSPEVQSTTPLSPMFQANGSNFFSDQYWKKQEETYGNLNLTALNIKRLAQESTPPNCAPQYITDDKVFKIFC